MTGESGGADDDRPEQELLAHERRRLALAVLQAFDEAITLADLAEEVAIRERDAPITDVSGETVADVYHSLYHTHVPALADADVVAYDQDADMVQAVVEVEFDAGTSVDLDRREPGANG